MAMDKKRRNQLIAGVGIAVVIIIIIIGASLLFQAPIPTEEEETSSFSLISFTDGEDVSNFVEISVWTPDPDATFDEDTDWQTLAKFEENIASKNAEDVTIDLTDYQYVWIEIDPDSETVFERNFIRISGGSNFAYTFDVYHFSSDVHLSTSGRETSGGWDLDTNGNYTLLMDFPSYTTADIHANSDDWETDDEEWDDLSDSEKEEYYDERNWRNQAPLYILGDDTDKDFETTIEMGTEFFAIEFDFNTTITTTDGDPTQVNFTADEDSLTMTKNSGDKIYIVYYGIVTAIQMLDFEIALGDDITCSTITAGRLAIDGDIDSFSASDFTAYSSQITA